MGYLPKKELLNISDYYEKNLEQAKTALNDLIYTFEPFKLFEPDPDYKADEEALRKSMQKSKKLIAFARKYIDEMETKSTKEQLIIMQYERTNRLFAAVRL